MTVESDLKTLKRDLGALAKAVEDIADIVEDMAKDRTKSSAGGIASRASHVARGIVSHNY